MGGFLSGVFGTQNQIGVNAQTPINTLSTGQGIQTGQNNYQSAQGQQQQLANTLGQQAQGYGPNPAQNMLNQQTQNNIRQGTGQIASQKGINPAMAARLASQNTGMMNQQAAGQGATMQAQQQLGAQGQLGNVLGTMGQQGIQSNAVWQQSLAAQNAAINQANSINVGVSGANQQAAQGALGAAGLSASDASSFLGSGSKAASMSKGGMVRGKPKGYDDGGAVQNVQYQEQSGPSSLFGQFLNTQSKLSQGANDPVAKKPDKNPDKKPAQPAQADTPYTDQNYTEPEFGASLNTTPAPPSLTDPGSMNYGSPQMQSPYGGTMLPMPSSNAFQPAPGSIIGQARGGMIPKNMKTGGKVAGQARVMGDSPKNDTVPAMLSPKEIVIPRSVAMSQNAPEKSAQFVAAVLAKQRMKK